MPEIAKAVDERRITGRTRLMTLLADPVSHVVGTEVITSFFRARGLDMVCVPLHVAPADLPRVIEAMRCMKNVVGSGVTIPHKIPVAALMDDLTARARMIGSVNYIRRDPDGRLVGDNVDGAGFVLGATRDGVNLKGLRVLQLGAGGAGRSVAFALAEAGVAELAIFNRDREKARLLAGAVASAFPAVRASAIEQPDPNHQMIVNTTPLGMDGQPGDPLDLSMLKPGTIVADIVLVPARTRLLQAAERLGCKTVAGAAMLDGQMALAADFLGIGGDDAA